MEPLVTVVNLNQNKRLYMFYSCANGTLTGHWATWTFNHKAKGKLLRFLFFRLWKIKHDSPVSCIVFFFFTLRRGHCISSSWFQVLYTFRETSLVTNYRNDPWKYSLNLQPPAAAGSVLAVNFALRATQFPHHLAIFSSTGKKTERAPAIQLSNAVTYQLIWTFSLKM